MRAPTLRARAQEGREQAAVVALLTKHFHTVDKSPMLITSAFSPGVRGVIYIEAFADSHAKTACEGVDDLLPYYRGGVRLVPVSEMVDAVRVKGGGNAVKEGAWVRVRRGVYKGDLAKVEGVLNTEMKVRVCACARVCVRAHSLTRLSPPTYWADQIVLRLIPRLDLSFIGLDLRTRAARRRDPSYTRPPRKLFSPSEVSGEGGRVEMRTQPDLGRQMAYFEGNYYERGCLLKTVALSAVSTEGVNPTMEEMRWFTARRGGRGGRGGGDGEEEEEEDDDVGMVIGGGAGGGARGAGRGGGDNSADVAALAAQALAEKAGGWPHARTRAHAPARTRLTLGPGRSCLPPLSPPLRSKQWRPRSSAGTACGSCRATCAT